MMQCFQSYNSDKLGYLLGQMKAWTLYYYFDHNQVVEIGSNVIVKQVSGWLAEDVSELSTTLGKGSLWTLCFTETCKFVENKVYMSVRNDLSMCSNMCYRRILEIAPSIILLLFIADYLLCSMSRYWSSYVCCFWFFPTTRDWWVKLI